MRLAKKRLLIISTVFALLLNNTLPFVKVSADEYLEPQIESNIQMEELNELETTIDPVDTSEIPDEKTESEKPPIIDQAEENEEVPEETETTEGAGTTHEEHVTDEEETSTANDPTTNDDKATSIEDSITDKEATEENESNKEDTFELTIMHTNDTHGALDNMPKTVTAVKDIRAKDPNALLLHAGDVFTGTLYFNEFHGQADLAFMNLMQFDVMTFGNHEFDLGSSPEGHKALADFIIGAEFPFVSANVDFSKDATFGGLFNDYITADFQNGQIYDGIIKEINGEKVGIFGLTTEETVAISSPGSITFQNYLEEAEKAVNYFESQGINKIIALTHIGYDDNAAVDNDLILAERVEGIDIIVGGHSHTPLQEPVKVENDETPTIIVQAGNANNNLGVLDVVFDEDGVIIEHSGELISIGTQEEDPEAVTLLAQYKERVDEVAQEEIGVVSPIELKNPRTGGDNTKPSVRKNETILGNLITDGMLAKAREFTGKNVVMALQNGGGIRAAIDAGPITVGEVITVLPFGNTLAIMDITGAELKEAFEISFKDYPGEFGGFLHVSGGMVEFDSTKPPGERVVGIYIKEDNGILVAVEDETMYTIATNAFTAKGGDGYTVFAKAYAEGRVTDLGLSDWENFRDHLINIDSEGIPTEVEGRIVDVADLFDLTIMHTNDTHARVEQFPYLSTIVNQIRAKKPNNLLVHAGDVFSGTLYFNVHQGLADLYFMNVIGFDVMTFGNHEFDKDSQTLANFVKDAQFPFVSANIDFSGDYELRTLAINEIGQPGEGGNIYPAIIKDFNGEKVGIFGLTTEETPIIASPSKAIKFNDAVKAAEETVKLLKDNGINKIIALSHLGYGADQQLAKKVDGIDVIVGGHSHTLLPEGLMIEKDEPTVIVQAGENLNNLGELNVSFDENGVIEDFSAEVHPLTDIDPDLELQIKLEEFQGKIEDLMKEVVGETTVHLDGERENVRTKETNLGNLIADGMVWKMQQFIPETTITLQNGGGIRASIEKGEITMGEVRTVLPFDNALVAIKLTGEELLQALEHSVSKYPEQSAGFLQVSGIKFKFDSEKEPYNRVWYVEVMSPDGEYVPLDLEEYYTVATNSFTAQGGDGYDSLKQAYEDGRMINIDIPDYEVFSEYLKEFSPVSPEVEGRIIAASKEEQKDNGEEPCDEQKPSEEDKGQDKKDGKVLPNTATHHGNTLVAGFLLIVASIVIYLYIRKRKIHS